MTRSALTASGAARRTSCKGTRTYRSGLRGTTREPGPSVKRSARTSTSPLDTVPGSAPGRRFAAPMPRTHWLPRNMRPIETTFIAASPISAETRFRRAQPRLNPSSQGRRSGRSLQTRRPRSRLLGICVLFLFCSLAFFLTGFLCGILHLLFFLFVILLSAAASSASDFCYRCQCLAYSANIPSRLFAAVVQLPELGAQDRPIATPFIGRESTLYLPCPVRLGL